LTFLLAATLAASSRLAVSILDPNHPPRVKGSKQTSVHARLGFQNQHPFAQQNTSPPESTRWRQMKPARRFRDCSKHSALFALDLSDGHYIPRRTSNVFETVLGIDTNTQSWISLDQNIKRDHHKPFQARDIRIWVPMFSANASTGLEKGVQVSKPASA
jgi:hypothetical protein